MTHSLVSSPAEQPDTRPLWCSSLTLLGWTGHQSVCLQLREDEADQ